jgi:hypothetical protein
MATSRGGVGRLGRVPATWGRARGAAGWRLTIGGQRRQW